MKKVDGKARKAITDVLFKLSQTRHTAIPMNAVTEVLAAYNLRCESFILCGREGRCNIELFDTITGEEMGSDIILSWLKGDTTQTYEVTMYLS